MIYILGTNLTESKLPLSGQLQYSIQNDKTKIAGILGIGIRKPDVIRCYIQNDIECKRIAPGCEDKIVRFTDDNDLLAKLSGSSSDNSKATDEQKESEALPEVAQETTTSDSEVEAMQKSIDKLKNAPKLVAPEKLEKVKEDKVEDVEEAAPITAPMFAPDSSDLYEVDMVRKKLAVTESALSTNRKKYEDLVKAHDELYAYAMAQSEEAQRELDEANKTIAFLQAEKEDSEHTLLGPFNVYVEKPRAIIKSGITLAGRPNMIAIAPGSFDSARSLYQSLALLAMSGSSCMILDFTGDPTFSYTLTDLARSVKRLKYQSMGRALGNNDYMDCALDPGKDFQQYLKVNRPANDTRTLKDFLNTNFGQAQVASAGFYHDICLLALDWNKLIEEAVTVSMGQPTIILLPCISSFVPRYLISYLATGIKCNIAVHCAPRDLACMESYLQTVQSGRLKILVMNYTVKPDTDNLLKNTINPKFAVSVFNENRFFRQEANVDAFNADMVNNARIWQEAFQNG